MIQFFRASDGVRLVFVLLLFLLPRLFVLLATDWQTWEREFDWILVGEYLHEGRLLYVQTWEQIEPLTAWLYGVLYGAFGRHPLGYRVVAMLVCGVQLLLFQRAIADPDIYRERTLLPTFLFALLLHTHESFLLLSPTLLALTFLLLALQIVFRLNEKTSVSVIFSLGGLLGVATLFFLGSFFFLLWALVGLATFRGTRLREYLVLLYGYLLPLLLMGMYLYVRGTLGAATDQLLVPLLGLGQWGAVLGINFSGALLVGVLWLGLALGMVQVLRTTSFVNFQTVRHQSMTVWVIFSLSGIFFTLNFTVYQHLLLLPAAAFFLTYLLLYPFRVWKRELAFSIYFLAVVFSFVQSTYTPFPMTAYTDYAQTVRLSDAPDFAGKRVWVLGDDPSFYQNNYAVMPYLNSRLLVLDLQRPQSYASLAVLAEQMLYFRPEIIVDPRDQFSLLLRRMPLLHDRYTYDATQQVWHLKEKEENARAL
ncbi:MAG: hypothetical protein ACFCUI_02200 [Bernardetiaceae bacterium]